MKWKEMVERHLGALVKNDDQLERVREWLASRDREASKQARSPATPGSPPAASLVPEQTPSRAG